MTRRTINVRSLVIVCEGSETEYRYFRDIKKYVCKTAPERFTKIHVVPLESEIIKEHNPNRPTRGKMKPAVDVRPHYWCLYEDSQQEYDKYKAQPTRYVREAYLFMKQEGYTEAWAVYDKDIHPEHKVAYSYAQSIPNMNVAISAYSFEEWLLAHFERNDYAFEHSDCKNNKKSIMCGTNIHAEDCHGTKCIAGRLREQKYIPDYAKNDEGIFEKYTLPRIFTALVNSAWLRHLSDACIFERNPYTDVDTLVLYLLGEKGNPYLWCSMSRPLRTKDLSLSVECDESGYAIRNNSGKSIVINSLNFTYLDAEFLEVGSVIDLSQILYAGESVKLKSSSPYAQYLFGDQRIIFDLK